MSPAASTPSSPGTTRPSWCRKADITITLGHTDAGTGHRSIALILTNTSNQPCRTGGYPGVATLDTNGTQTAQARRTLHGYLGGLRTGTPPTLTLTPGQQASALLEATAFDTTTGAACPAYTGLLITLPNDTTSTPLTWTTDSCANPQIHPVVPGTTGQGD